MKKGSNETNSYFFAKLFAESVEQLFVLEHVRITARYLHFDGVQHCHQASIVFECSFLFFLEHKTKILTSVICLKRTVHTSAVASCSRMLPKVVSKSSESMPRLGAAALAGSTDSDLDLSKRATFLSNSIFNSEFSWLKCSDFNSKVCMTTSLKDICFDSSFTASDSSLTFWTSLDSGTFSPVPPEGFFSLLRRSSNNWSNDENG